MSYQRMYYTEEISGVDAEMWAEFCIDFINHHGGQYTCEVGRKHHSNTITDATGKTITSEWSEKVYTLKFMLYPHEYENMMREMMWDGSY